MTPAEIFAAGMAAGAAGFFAICGGMCAWIYRPREVTVRRRSVRRVKRCGSWCLYCQ